jgi:hypothetical protein
MTRDDFELIEDRIRWGRASCPVCFCSDMSVFIISFNYPMGHFGCARCYTKFSSTNIEITSEKSLYFKDYVVEEKCNRETIYKDCGWFDH